MAKRLRSSSFCRASLIEMKTLTCRPQRFLVDGGDIAADDAALFQQFDPAVAGRHRQADLVGELLHGDAAVGLQLAQDLAVDGVEGGHWNELWF